MVFRLSILFSLVFSINSFAVNIIQVQETDTVVNDTIVQDTVVDNAKVNDTIVQDTLINPAIVNDTLVNNSVVQDSIVNDTIVKVTLVNGTVVKDTLIVSDTISIKKESDTIVKQTIAVKEDVSQDTTVVKDEKITYWSKVNKLGLTLNEVAFVNWSSGGNNSFSALSYVRFERKYEKNLLNWENILDIRYGFNAQEGRKLRKSEDNIEIHSNFGYRQSSESNWFYSAKLDFSTQFTNGYKYPNTDEAISKFMAPGYLFIGVGTEFSSPTEDLTLYISPITDKSTFVLDERLSNSGAFGVRPAVRDEEGNIIQQGERVRTQMGFLFSSVFSKEIWEDVGINNRLRLYSDYLNKFGNVDVDWELRLNLKVNEYVVANVGSHLKYDDDVKIKKDIDGDGELETGGPRIQFKQMLGVGVVYQF